MWHSLPDGVTPLLSLSVALALQAAEEISALQGHAHVSQCVQSRRQISAAFEFGKQKALRQRGRRNELPLPSASRPSLSLAAWFTIP